MCAGGRFQYVVRSGAASDANEAKEFDEFDEDTITFGGVEEHNDVLTYILDQDVLLDVFRKARKYPGQVRSLRWYVRLALYCKRVAAAVADKQAVEDERNGVLETVLSYNHMTFGGAGYGKTWTVIGGVAAVFKAFGRSSSVRCVMIGTLDSRTTF